MARCYGRWYYFAVVKLTIKFFKRLQQLSKVKLTERMNRVIEASKGSSRIQLLSIDITNISTKVRNLKSKVSLVKVKHLDLIDMAEGKMLYLQAQDKHYNLYQKERLFRLASERFKAGTLFLKLDANFNFSNCGEYQQS